MWINIIQMTTNMNIEFKKDDLPVNFPNKPNTYLLSDVEILSGDFMCYTYVLSIIIFVYTIKIVRFIRFSKSFYSIIKILDHAKNSIWFHLIFIFIMYFGFVLWGFALFGTKLYEFSTILTSIIELLTIIS